MSERLLALMAIAASFTLASAINVYPLSFTLAPFRPMTLILVLIFWAIYQPRLVGVGVAFLVGLSADLLFDTHLGHQAFCAVAMVFGLRIATNYTKRLSFASAWILAVVALTGYRCLLWLFEFLSHTHFAWTGLVSLVLSILLFPVVWWLLFTIQQRIWSRSFHF